MSEIKTSRPTVTTAATLQPVTLEQARTQVFLAADDDSHDTELSDIIDAAVEQYENDTDSFLMSRQLRTYIECLDDDEIYLPGRPIPSVQSILYYDPNNAQQTLSSSAYSLDSGCRAIRLNTNYAWPAIYSRWDAVQVNYTAGYSTQSEVPALAKRAILLLVGYYFAANRGDNDRPGDMTAYQSLIARAMRPTYP